MISDKKQNELLKKIENIEEEIQEVYYTGEFDIANQFKMRLSTIKGEISVEPIGFYIDKDSEFEVEIEQKIENLETEILFFLKEKSNTILENEIEKDDVIPNLQGKSTEELWNELKDIANKLNKCKCSSIEKQEWNRKIAKAVLKIIKEEAKRGEEIRIGKAQQYCKLEDFLFVIKENLIEMAQRQDREEQKNTLKMAKELNLGNINYVKLWQKLTNIDDLKISNIEEINQNENYALTVVNQKKSLVQTIREKIGIKNKTDKPKTTVYTFGDINPETLEWENVEIIIDEFPKKFSKEQTRRVLAVEINDVPKVTEEHELGKYPNLQTVTFGRNVKSIGEKVFYHLDNKKYIKELIDLSKLNKKDYEHLNKDIKYYTDFTLSLSGKIILYSSLVKEIKISDSVVELENQAFRNLPELQKIEFGNGISTIPTYCCADCDQLKEIKFSDNLKEIEAYAFFSDDKIYSSYLQNIFLYGRSKDSLFNLRLPILKKYENKYQNLVTLPKSIKKIGYKAFGINGKKRFNEKGGFSITLTKEQYERFGKNAGMYTHNIIISDQNIPIKPQQESGKKVKIKKRQTKNIDDNRNDDFEK